MNTRTNQLPVGTPVEVTAHRHTGWTGTIERAAFGLYDVNLTHDCDGERLAAPHRAGPFVRSELRPLTDPQPARQGPYDATDGVPFLRAGDV